jgi:hypothetical protein
MQPVPGNPRRIIPTVSAWPAQTMSSSEIPKFGIRMIVSQLPVVTTLLLRTYTVMEDMVCQSVVLVESQVRMYPDQTGTNNDRQHSATYSISKQ